MTAIRSGRLRRALERLHAYDFGPPAGRAVVQLASNEGTFGPMAAAREAMAQLGAHANRYPDSGCTKLRDALARRHGVSVEQIVVGAGSESIVNYLSMALLEPDDEVAHCNPTFPAYRTCALKMGARAVTAPLKDGDYDLAALLGVITDRTKIAYLANPNNPTGAMIGRGDLARFLARLPAHVLPVIDEAYHEYVEEPDYADPIREHVVDGRQVMVLRTFSKIYGLAGLRVGYAIAPPEIAEACVKVRNAFDVGLLAQGMALASLDCDAELAERRRFTRRRRESLRDGLLTLGYAPKQSVANFVYFRANGAADVARALLERGVLVRNLAGFGDPDALRVTVGTDDENLAFLEALRGLARATGR
jgi:histidinol-phosphate aminotransferase